MGGNAATQTLTVIVRGIALGELTWSNTRKALLKEAVVGLGNGVACGAIGALVAWLFSSDPMLGGILAMTHRPGTVRRLRARWVLPASAFATRWNSAALELKWCVPRQPAVM